MIIPVRRAVGAGGSTFFRHAFVGQQRAAVQLDLVNRRQRHAEIAVKKRAVAFHAAHPARQVGHFLDLTRRAGAQGNFPFIAADEAIARLSFLKPFVTQQDADGFFPRRAEPVKNNARIRVAKQVIGDFQRVVVRRRELRLEAHAETARHAGRGFEKEVLGENPERFGRMAVAGKTFLPDRQCFVQRGAGEFGFAHWCL